MVNKVIKVSEIEDDSQAINGNGKRSSATADKEPKKRLKTKSLYRQPTANELNRLQETANLFNSNLFRLQVEEVIEEVKVKEKTEKRIQKWYSEFKNHLLSISEDDVEYDLAEGTLSKKLKVKLPFPNRLKKTKCMFKFHKFSNIEIVGSYAIGCSINSKLQVNIQISVPADTFTKNDSINYKYHKKRAAYLAVIASHLKDHETVAEINYHLNGTEGRPELDIKPSGKLSKYLTVRLDLSCEAEAYKLHRFSPSRNNVRRAWMFPDDAENDEVGPPTPYYNSSILQDLTASVNQEFLKDTLLKCENLKQAVVLLKIWIKQRNLKVSGYILSMIVSHLVHTKRINNIMSSYQIVRNVWITLKSSEWDVQGISLYKGDNTPSLKEFHEHFPVVFLDRTGYYNICWQMCKGTYDALRRECVLAVEMLDDPKLNSFLPLFMTPVLPILQFDHILRFKDMQKLKESVICKVPKAAQLNYGLDELVLVTDRVHALLAKGLGNRVDLILPLGEDTFSWSVGNSLDKSRRDGNKQQLSFGLILNPDNYSNCVEKGPPANLPEAEEFRSFWGEKSELRRFQDGSITETCVWAADSLAERRGVTRQIIDYLLHVKLGITSEEVFHVGSQFERLLSRAGRPAGGEEAALAAARALDLLRRDLRALPLPLPITGLAGVSPVFSYCDPAPALPVPARGAPWRRGDASLVKDVRREDGSLVAPEYVPVCRAVVELGHSGKWPGDLEALRCLKAGFYLQLASEARARLSLAAHAQAEHVDVLRDGLVFRLQLALPKEITLVRKRVRAGVAAYAETDESVRLQCETVLMPRLRGALHGLQQKHPAFGAGACLLKRWLRAQLVDEAHFPDAAADLLAAAAFTRPAPLAPLTPPATPQPALLRALHLLARTDWRRDLLVLDFNGDLSRDDVADLERQWAAREPQPTRMRIVTAHDAAAALPSVWTAHAPTEHTLARVRGLAEAALRYFTDALLTGFADDVLGAFVPSLTGFDVLIHLRAELVPHAAERVGRAGGPCPLPAVGEGEDADGDVIPVVEFNPVQEYLNELRSAYDEFALFFHDTYGGTVIAVLWKPDISQDKDFQPLGGGGVRAAGAGAGAGAGARCRVNVPALIEDFRILGDGLVQHIVVNT